MGIEVSETRTDESIFTYNIHAKTRHATIRHFHRISDNCLENEYTNPNPIKNDKECIQKGTIHFCALGCALWDIGSTFALSAPFKCARHSSLSTTVTISIASPLDRAFETDIKGLSSSYSVSEEPKEHGNGFSVVMPWSMSSLSNV